jgi:hypothetical protein
MYSNSILNYNNGWKISTPVFVHNTLFWHFLNFW